MNLGRMPRLLQGKEEQGSRGEPEDGSVRMISESLIHGHFFVFVFLSQDVCGSAQAVEDCQVAHCVVVVVAATACYVTDTTHAMPCGARGCKRFDLILHNGQERHV
jgi:hypothetical protein